MDETLGVLTETTSLTGVLKVTRPVHSDRRGCLWSVCSGSEDFGGVVKGLDFKHIKFNTNDKGVLRGIHFDDATTKLVSCVSGALTQFVINVDEASVNFGKYEKFELRAGDGISVLIPAGYGNAFVARENSTTYCYLLSYSGSYIDADQQGTLSYMDERLDIEWGVENPILSSRDGVQDES